LADPLETFRRKPVVTPAKAPTPPLAAGREPYQAFATKDKLNRVDIRTRDGLAHAPGYNYIVDISYDRREYKAVALILSFMVVRLRGHHLRPVVEALKLHTCEFLAEYSPDEYELPSDEDAPFIDSIRIETGSRSAQREQEREPAAQR
jgi:hypothetical protein